MKTRNLYGCLAALFLFGTINIFADPAPGDVFREYIWIPGGSKFVRVGGSEGYGGGSIPFNGTFDLTGATKAEVNVQKLLCHHATRGLSFSFNNKDYIKVPESDSIPTPQWDYQHMIYPNVPIPLTHLKATGNSFRLKVDKVGWWPQNMVYGIVVRIYYGPSKPHSTGKIIGIASGGSIGMQVTLKAEATPSPAGTKIKKVEYLGYYEGFNYEGDGIYRQWHYHFLGQYLKRHIGTSFNAPYGKIWKTDWIPDQSKPIKICARVIDDKGMIYMTPAIDNLQLSRPGYTVRMYKPYDIPHPWVTRKGTQSEKFDVPATDDLSKVSGARMIWVSWCGCYAQGILINNKKVIDKATSKCYSYDFNDVSFQPTMIKNGVNVLTTNAGPSGHHGMEVNYPGIVVFLKFGALGLRDKHGALSQPGPLLGRISIRRFHDGMVFSIPNHAWSGNLRITDVSGRLVRVLESRQDASGLFQWDQTDYQGAQAAPGVYLLRTDSGKRIFSGKTVLTE